MSLNNSSEKLNIIRDNGYIDLVPDNYVTYYRYMTTIDHIFIKNDYVEEAKLGLIPSNLSNHACLICEIEANKDK